MKKISIIFFICIFLSSCKEESLDFGTVKYYPEFLWVDANITPVEKTMDCEFSLDAQNDANSFAEFQFVDNEGNPVQTSEMQVKVDGASAHNNTFRVNSNTKSVKLDFTFSPDAKTGKHQGYLKLINHELDRIDSHQLSNGQKVDVFQWTINYNKGMNPLMLALIWLAVILVSYALLKLFVIRPIRYPKFGAIQKTIIVPGMAPLVIRFKGARMVVLSATSQKKQSAWDCFWNGKILYKIHPAFTTPIYLKPSRGKRILAKSQTGVYRILPNPIPGIGSASIDIIQTNQHILIN